MTLRIELCYMIETSYIMYLFAIRREALMPQQQAGGGRANHRHEDLSDFVEQ